MNLELNRRQPEKTMLIVDQDDQLVSQLTSRCREMGLCVLTANTAEQAVIHMSHGMPDLLCIDAYLAADKGQTFLERINKHKPCRNLATIVLCHEDDLNKVQGATKLPAYCVAKPNPSWARIEMLIDELVVIEPITTESECFES